MFPYPNLIYCYVPNDFLLLLLYYHVVKIPVTTGEWIFLKTIIFPLLYSNSGEAAAAEQREQHVRCPAGLNIHAPSSVAVTLRNTERSTLPQTWQRAQWTILQASHTNKHTMVFPADWSRSCPLSHKHVFVCIRWRGLYVNSIRPDPPLGLNQTTL